MAGSDNPEGHFGAQKLTRLHTDHKSGEEDGACLTAHQGSYEKFKNKITCNYRHQAYEQAKAETRITTRLHRYKRIRNMPTRITTSGYRTERGMIFPNRYAWSLPAPGNGDWDVGGPTGAAGVKRQVMAEDKKRKQLVRQTDHIPKGQNFTTVTWPYWNNAHHILPKSALYNCISALLARTSNLMQQCLLEAKYNLNHKLNMFMMPMDKKVAAILKLTRHLQLQEKKKGVRCSVADHPEYTTLVVQDLQKAIDHFKQVCEDAIKKAQRTKHKIPKAKLSKQRLVNISKKFLTKLLDWGEDDPGFSTSDKAQEEMAAAPGNPTLDL